MAAAMILLMNASISFSFSPDAVGALGFGANTHLFLIKDVLDNLVSIMLTLTGRLSSGKN